MSGANENRKLTIGVIGLGVGERHIAGYEAHPACRVKSLCDFSQQKLEEVGRRHPGLHLTASSDEVLDDPEIDVVSIASYDDVHHVQTIRALERGKHVFLEKPICLFEKEAREIREALNAFPKQKFSSNLILRRSPRFIRIRDEVRAGKFGRIFHIEGDYNYGRLWKLTEDWRGRLPFYSLVYGGGVHMVDLMQWITGNKVVEVSAIGNKICSEGTRFKNFDLVAALLTFEDGSSGKVSVNGGCVQPHFHALSVFGTEATFINSPEDGRIYRDRDERKKPEAVKEAYPGFEKGDLLGNFIDAILGKAPLAIGPDEVFSSMSVCFAIEKAINTGRSVKVESF